MKSGDEYTTDPGGLPVFLFIDGNLIAQSVMIYPFDTGAYDRYGLSCDLSRDDFVLPPVRTSVDRVVATFYEGAGDYYWIRPKHLNISVGASPLKQYYRMLTATHPRREDGRESSIEVAFDQPIPLAGNLKLALVPRVGGEMIDLGPTLLALGCQNVSYYSWTARYRRSDFRQLLWQSVADHLGF